MLFSARSVRILLMKMQPECVSCILEQVKTVTTMLGLDQQEKDAAMQDALNHLANADYEGCTPESMGNLWQVLLTHVKDADPYAQIKTQSNKEAEKMIPATREKIERADDPLTIALKYSIAGNLIDYGLKEPVPLEEQNAQIDAIAHTPFSIDDSALLRQTLRKSKTLLYLGDNAGEIVFDKLLIETIRSMFPQLSIAFVVKGSPVLNDVTYREAREVGMQDVARILDNGDSSPGTVLPRTSEAFRQEFMAADVVLSKGQGNFESLGESGKENLFFLFTAKCDSVCEEAGVPKFSIVCMKNRVF